MLSSAAHPALCIAESWQSLIRGCMALLTISVVALAQEAPVAPGVTAVATVPAGVPLRVALERRVAIKRVGEPTRGGRARFRGFLHYPVAVG